MNPDYIQDSLDLDIEVEPPPSGFNEWPRAKYGKEEKVVGYSIGKWSDDDDICSPITPFLGVHR